MSNDIDSSFNLVKNAALNHRHSKGCQIRFGQCSCSHGDIIESLNIIDIAISRHKWRTDIENAPKDGSVYPAGCFIDGIFYWRASSYSETFGRADFIEDNKGRIHLATHWMQPIIHPKVGG